MLETQIKDLEAELSDKCELIDRLEEHESALRTELKQMNATLTTKQTYYDDLTAKLRNEVEDLKKKDQIPGVESSQSQDEKKRMQEAMAVN